VLRKSSLLPQTRPDSKQFLPECGKVSGNSEDSGWQGGAALSSPQSKARSAIPPGQAAYLSFLLRCSAFRSKEGNSSAEQANLFFSQHHIMA
jgi:hypothetical protein